MVNKDCDEKPGLRRGMGLMMGNGVYNDKQSSLCKMEFIIQDHVHCENPGW